MHIYMHISLYIYIYVYAYMGWKAHCEGAWQGYGCLEKFALVEGRAGKLAAGIPAYFQKWTIVVYMDSLGWQAHSTTVAQQWKLYLKAPAWEPTQSSTHKYSMWAATRPWILGRSEEPVWVPQSGAKTRQENMWPTVGSHVLGSKYGSVWRPAFWHRELARWWVTWEDCT
jgi:hypothetical protein